MRNILVPAVAAAALFSVPVFAQTNSSSNSTTKTRNSNSEMIATQTEQDIQQNLSKAGYTNIKVVPGSFLVTAKDSKGLPTEMVITPNSVTAITAMNETKNSGQTGTGTNGNGNTSKN